MHNSDASATCNQGLSSLEQYRHLMQTHPQVCCMISLRPFAKCTRLLSGMRDSVRARCGLHEARHRSSRLESPFQLHDIQVTTLAAAIAGCSFMACAMNVRQSHLACPTCLHKWHRLLRALVVVQKRDCLTTRCNGSSSH